jgi:hypothetical protein
MLAYSIGCTPPIINLSLESYQGKHARIMYEVEVVVDMGRWKRDYHYTLPFAVINPKMDYRIGDRYYLGKEQEKKEGRPYLALNWSGWFLEKLRLVYMFHFIVML